jgi:hypothetical protein
MSLLLLGLFAATYDGFRERSRSVTPGSSATTPDVRAAEGMPIGAGPK